MQVNFTGIKNIGFIQSCCIYKPAEHSNGTNTVITQEEYPLQRDGYLMNIQLTDDYNGKHLTNFKKALEKSGLSFYEYKHPVNKNFLNILATEDTYDEGEFEESYSDFTLNGKPLEVTDKTLPLFSYLAKLVREISLKPKKEFVVNSDYLASDDLNEGLIIGQDMQKICGKDFEKVILDAHDPKFVKNGAAAIDNIIMDTMENYFTVEPVGVECNNKN